MNPVYVIALVLVMAVCHGCESTRPLQNNDLSGQVTIITVDCKNDPSVKSLVMQLLRMARVSDWVIRDNGLYQDIEARYKEITPRQQADIEDHLKQTGGVLTVEVKKDNIPLRNP